jgi:hypothetical protein
MTTEQIVETLNNFVPFDDGNSENDNESFLLDLMDNLGEKPDLKLAFEPIFKLIEKYPHADFGNPGPLVHLLEANTDSYEDLLQQSLNRNPTSLTVLMLNRMIDAENNAIIKANLLDRLCTLTNHPNIDIKTKDVIEDYIDFQNKHDIT